VPCTSQLLLLLLLLRAATEPLANWNNVDVVVVAWIGS